MEIEFFLVHPGGPFFAKKDAGWWTIPKGEPMPGEDPFETAKREFREETGFMIDGEFIALGTIQQKGGKKVMCWAVEGDVDASLIVNNTFQLNWPPRSNKVQLFPEIDKAGWFDYKTAVGLINERQIALLDELIGLMGAI